MAARSRREFAQLFAFGGSAALYAARGSAWSRPGDVPSAPPAPIEARSRQLAQALIDGLRRIDGVKVWTHTDSGRSAAIVSFQPAALDVAKLHQALYERDHVACATRGGADRGGLRFSPHFYNLQADVERAVEAIGRYVKKGL